MLRCQRTKSVEMLADRYGFQLHSEKSAEILCSPVREVTQAVRFGLLCSRRTYNFGSVPLVAFIGVLSIACSPTPSLTIHTPSRTSAQADLLARSPLPSRKPTPKAKVAIIENKEPGRIQNLPVSTPDDALILATTARCPEEMTLVDDVVCIDRWEASLVERFVGGERPWSPFSAVDGRERSVRAVSLPNVIPQGYISGKQAMMACQASGKRLCTSDEWLHACRGPANTVFPYGALRQDHICNDDIRTLHPVAEVGSLLAITKEDLWREAMNNPLINQLPESLLPTGERAECTNSYGIFDMVGNLHEWVDDPDGTFRGGYYMDTTRNGDGCKYSTTAHDFTYHDYSTGFRCCMDAERVE